MISVVSAVRDLGRLREITSVLVKHGFGELVTRAGFGRKKGPSIAPPKGSQQDKGSANAAAQQDKHSLAPPALGTGESNAPAKDGEGLSIVTDEMSREGELARERSSRAERIRLVLQDLGPSFIKLGQIVSTRPDLIPADVIAELKRLQDDVPPVPFADIKGAIESSLAETLSSVYLSFDETPLATASIGQVHRARIRLDEGEQDVVVKVQRPGVSSTVIRDLELLHVMAATIERAIPETKIYSPVGLVQQFDRSITAELNFTTEAENAERFGKNFENHPHVRFPKVYRQASSKHVLTMEFFKGRKIEQALAEGLPGPLVAKRAVGIVIKMIFEDGFFHADPHPGNIILLGTNEEPVIGLIDVGMVGRLSPELRDRTVDLMVAAVRKDSYAVADALYAIGRPTRKIDMREYRAEVAVLAEKYVGKTLKDIELSAMIRDLVQGAMKFGLEIPPDFMLVGKALMTIEGIGRQLDPELDVFGEASPYFINIMKQRYSPERLGNELWRGMEQLSRAGYDLPLQVREVLDDVRLGRLTVRTEDTPSKTAVDTLGSRLFAGLFALGLLGSGSYLLAAKNIWGAAIMYVLSAAFWARNALRKKT